MKALRADHPELLVFTAIVGVPQQLVTPEALDNVAFDKPTARNAFYNDLLAHPAMREEPQEEPDPGTLMGNPNVMPSCLFDAPTAQVTRAFPPRRIVKVARELGENARVFSICTDNFGPAIDLVATLIATKLGRPVCR